ncbi:hypothetical protein VF12_38565 [Nostoc linckia z15]|nr:hypothetical protein VF12_38565 [Nostoc linckia z15]
MKRLIYIYLISLLFVAKAFSQQQEEQPIVIVQDSTQIKTYTIDPLAPSKAAFYSAVVPGLGQAYNKKYWKVPIVYGSMALSLYYYIWNNGKYHDYRDAYKTMLAGGTVTGEFANMDADRLIRAQRFHQRNRDLSLLITVGLYVLQIVEANVNAHLMQFNVNENLSLRPQMRQNDFDRKFNTGLSLNYQF